MATRPIVDTLREMRRGEMLDEASDALAELVKRVQHTGKKGSLTLKLNVSPMQGTAGTMVVISDDITLKVPLLGKEPTVFFPTEDGNLQRNDPRQQQLALRAVERSSAPNGPVNSDGEFVASS